MPRKNTHLTENDVRAIRESYKARSHTSNQYKLAQKYGVRQQCISRILRGERWSHVA